HSGAQFSIERSNTRISFDGRRLDRFAIETQFPLRGGEGSLFAAHSCIVGSDLRLLLRYFRAVASSVQPVLAGIALQRLDLLVELVNSVLIGINSVLNAGNFGPHIVQLLQRTVALALDSGSSRFNLLLKRSYPLLGTIHFLLRIRERTDSRTRLLRNGCRPLRLQVLVEIVVHRSGDHEVGRSEVTQGTLGRHAGLERVEQ